MRTLTLKHTPRDEARERAGIIAWRNAGFVGAAVLFHAVLVAVLPFVRRPHLTPPPPPAVEIEIEAAPAHGGTKLARGDVTGHTTRNAAGYSLGVRAHAQAHPGDTNMTVEPEATTTPGPAAQESGEPAPSLMGPHSIGLDGPGSFRMDVAKQLPDEQTLVNEATRHAIVDPLRAHDAMNGDLTSGPLAQELERTTRRMDGTPFEGRAVFSVSVDELGLVVSVGVSEASGSRAVWDEVAHAVMNAFAQKRLHVPAGAKRVAMQIEISSKVVLPSGARHPMTVDSPAVEGLEHAVHGQFDRPAASPSIVSGSFDVSDIGAHPQRIVGARVLSEQTY